MQASSDAVAEGTEQFTAVLTNPSAGATLGDDIATVDIIDSSGRGGIKVLCQHLNAINISLQLSLLSLMRQDTLSMRLMALSCSVL